MSVLYFPGCEPPPDPTESPPTHEDFLYTEVMEWAEEAGALTLIEDPESFWEAAKQVRERLNGWFSDG